MKKKNSAALGDSFGVPLMESEDDKPSARKATTPEEHAKFVKVLETAESRRAKVLRVQFIVLLLLVFAYFIYQVYYFFNTSLNRVHSTENTNVDTMPSPYIYISHESGNYSACNVSVYPGQGRWTDNNVKQVNADEIDSLDSSNLLKYKSAWLLIKNDKYESGAYTQWFVIPPTNATLEVANNDGDFQVSLYCTKNESVLENIDLDEITYHIDNTEQLDTSTIDSSNIYDILKTIDSKSTWTYTGYILSVYIEWISFDNKINGETSDNDYYITSTGATFPTSNREWTETTFTIFPDTAGRKITYITDYDISIYDIFSLSGGMYSTISGITMLIAVAIIWGFDWKILQWDGIAHEAGYEDGEKEKLDIYMAERGYTKLLALEDEVKQLKTKLEQMSKQNHSQTQQPFNE